MTHRFLQLKKEENVAFIDMCGAVSDIEKSLEVRNEIAEVCREIDFDSRVYVVVLKGIGAKRCEAISGLTTVEKGLNKGSPSLALYVSRLDRPVIAEMKGDIIWEGLEIALACDMRVAGQNCRFALPHVQYGLMPSGGETQRLPRLIGPAKAMEIILAGEMIDAQEALRIGLVNRIVKPDKVSETIMEMAREMASKGPIALRYAKEAINKGMDLGLEQGLRLEADLYLLLHTTRDRTEGIRAFQEKRKPHFQER